MTLGEIRRRPNLPGRFQPSTFSVLRLNFCVRDGNRWIPQAIVTGNFRLSRFPSHPQNRTGRSPSLARLTLTRSLLSFDILRFLSSLRASVPALGFASLPSAFASLRSPTPFCLLPSPSSQDQALDRLVSPSSIHCCTSTDDLSTLSSSRGLTHFQ